MQFHRKLIDEGPWIEFLIPLTIVAAAFKNVVSSPARSRWTAPLLAGGFGVIHGAGFANSLQGLFGDQVLVPLFGFDLGIEAGQLVVVATLLSVFSLADQLRTAPSTGRGVRMREAMASSLAEIGGLTPATAKSRLRALLLQLLSIEPPPRGLRPPNATWTLEEWSKGSTDTRGIAR